MNLEFEKDIEKQRIIFSINNSEEIIDYQLKMLLNNKSNSLCDISITQFDMKSMLYYDISNKITLEKYLSKNLLSKNDFISIAKQIILCFKECKELLLDYHKLVIDIDKIYIRSDGRSLSMLYLPLIADYKDGKQSLVNLINKLLSNVNKKESNIDEIIKEVILYVNSEAFNVFELEGILRKYENEGEVINKRDEVIDEVLPKEESDNENIQMSIIEKLKTPLGIGIQSILGILVIGTGLVLYQANLLADNLDKYIGGIVLLLAIDYLIMDRLELQIANNKKKAKEKEIEIIKETEEDRTIVLTNIAYIKHLNQDKEEIYINKPSFLVGKIRDKVDLYIENATISRHHAEIFNQDESYYIRDLESRNGTYVNEEKLELNQIRKLESEDIIKFSNESFKFVCRE